MLDKLVSFKSPAGIHGKKKLNPKWKPLLQSALCLESSSTFFLDISWSYKSSSLSLQTLPLFIILWCGHLDYRNLVDNHGANHEISSFLSLPLLPVATAKPALSAFAFRSAWRFAVSHLRQS